jgi:hypothetical protein
MQAMGFEIAILSIAASAKLVTVSASNGEPPAVKAEGIAWGVGLIVSVRL